MRRAVVLLCAAAAGAVELTDVTYDELTAATPTPKGGELTAGKSVFISEAKLVADVDCTSEAGRPLCETLGIEESGGRGERRGFMQPGPRVQQAKEGERA
eukprot:gene9851-17223_t